MYEPMLSIAGNRKLAAMQNGPPAIVVSEGIPPVVYALGGAVLGYFLSRADRRITPTMGTVLGGVIGLALGGAFTTSVPSADIEESEDLDVELEESF